jgi:uncharacterized protein YbjT (DUF2867 family)
MNAKRIVVTGATGQQGGAVVRHLLKQPGIAVRALVRQPDHPAAGELRLQGVELIPGDLEDLPSLKRALGGAYGAFSVQSDRPAGFDAEVRQGKAMADAAKAAGVTHFVYSSVAGADKKTGVPHFESKWEIERHIIQLGLSCTILRPVFFMQNWRNFFHEPILRGTLPLPLDRDRPLQQISVDDIGAFATMAFTNPPKWAGRIVELAGDELTMPETASVFTGLLGRTVKHQQVPWDQFAQTAGDEITRMYRWFNEDGFHADIRALRHEYHSLATLEQTLHRQPWSLEALAA